MNQTDGCTDVGEVSCLVADASPCECNSTSPCECNSTSPCECNSTSPCGIVDGPLYLGFASQKGGVGKSTLAEVISSILAYDFKLRLLVVDCDSSQESFLKLRLRELSMADSEESLTEFFRDRFEALGCMAYPVVHSPYDVALSMTAQRLASTDAEYDVVVFDLPGFASSESLMQLALGMDYLVSPIEPVMQSLVSCLSYGSVLHRYGVHSADARLRDVLLLWNKIDRRSGTPLVKYFSDQITRMGMTLMESVVLYREVFRKELSVYGVQNGFLSTLVSPPARLRRDTGIDAVVRELLERTGLWSRVQRSEPQLSVCMNVDND